MLRHAPELAAERQGLDAWLAAPPDKTLALIAEMDDIAAPGQGPVIYACPMHPEVTSAGAGPLPRMRDEAAGHRRGDQLTPARCTRRSPATSPAAAPSAA